eukprot:1162029-Pelagomonas_calceolata.AAC.10
MAIVRHSGGEVVCYGCASGKAPQWTWQGFVFRELKVTGFNMRRWMGGSGRGGILASNTTAATASKRFLPVLESLMKLMDAGLLNVAYTECNVYVKVVSSRSVRRPTDPKTQSS